MICKTKFAVEPPISMRDSENPSRVPGTKKFLYTGPRSKVREQQAEETWNFGPKPNNVSPRGAHFDLDEAWSIKRNVTVGKEQKSPLGLGHNTSKSYYSRYGGVKEKDEFDSAFGGSSQPGGKDSGSRSWNTANREGVSYSYSNTGASRNPDSSRRNQLYGPSQSQFTGGRFNNNYSEW